MKKTLFVLLMFAMLLSGLVACTQAKEPESPKPIDDMASYLTESFAGMIGSDPVVYDDFDTFFLEMNNAGTSLFIEERPGSDEGSAYVVYLEKNDKTSPVILGSVFSEDKGWSHGTLGDAGEECKQKILSFNPESKYGIWNYNPSTKQLVYTSSSETKGYYYYDCIAIKAVEDPKA